MPFGCSGTRRAFVSAVQLFTRCPNTSSGRAPGELGAIAHRWFDVMRSCGDEVRELLRDGCPVACLGDAPFAYVKVFTSHVNVGFFKGIALPDPARLLQGEGKFMRHVKLRPGTNTNTVALSTLIADAYADIKVRVENG